MNRTKVTLEDYLNIIEILKPQMAVSPIEELASDSGNKKVQRAVRHSILAYEEVTKLFKSTQWVAPVVLEDPKMLKSIEANVPIFIYGSHS
jgi:hypothetical protein